MLLTTADELYPSDDVGCFLCLEPAADAGPVVFWRGAVDIYLHAACSGPFVLRVARDALDAEHAMRA